MERMGLQIADYVIIVVMLAIPLAIGGFFAVRDAKRTTREEYLLGGRSMAMLPVALSIFVTFQSAISLIGMPSDVYQHGPMVFVFYIGISISYIIAYYILPPLMHPLKLTSIYEYLEMRFQSRFVRLFSTIIGMLQTFFYMVVALLAPGLALEAAAGIPLFISVVIVGATGTVYTCAGGIKSVVWTDAFQTIIMFVGVVGVIAKTFLDVGGAGKLWEIVDNGGRSSFNSFVPDPRVRHTWVGLLLGACFTWMSNQFTQSTVQRLSSMKTVKEARTSMAINMPINLFYGFMVTTVGWCLYAYLFHIRCDPYQSGLVSNTNQMTPFYVIHVMFDMPGMAGLYMSALFSGALSTVSSGINSLAANTVEDLIKRRLRTVSEKTATTITKIFVFVYGIIIIAVVYMARSLKGPVTQMASSVFGTFGSAVLGMFLLGCTIPWANKYGVLTGGIVSLSINVFIALSNRLYGRPPDKLEPAPSDHCFNLTDIISEDNMSSYHYNHTVNMPQLKSPINKQNPEYGFFLYEISYEWYSVIGVVVCFSLGLLVSRITRTPETSTTDPKLILPFLRKYWGLPDPVKFSSDLEREMVVVKDDGAVQASLLSSEKQNIDFLTIG